MNYYWFNRDELFKNARTKYHNKGGKEKADEYYPKNKEATKEKTRDKYKNLSEKEKELKRQYSRNQYKKLKQK